MTAHSDTDRPKQVIKFSWETIHTAIDCLAHSIQQIRPSIHLIVGVSRGGLVPATLLSHKLDIPMEVIHASAYEGTRRTLQKPIIVEGWKQDYDTSHTVIVDDILDSGATLRTIADKASGLWRFHYFSLVNKCCERFPGHKNYFARVPNDAWVQFPWEGAE